MYYAMHGPLNVKKNQTHSQKLEKKPVRLSAVLSWSVILLEWSWCRSVHLFVLSVPASIVVWLMNVCSSNSKAVCWCVCVIGWLSKILNKALMPILS